jgi:hypothetical protein
MPQGVPDRLTARLKHAETCHFSEVNLLLLGPAHVTNLLQKKRDMSLLGVLQVERLLRERRSQYRALEGWEGPRRCLLVAGAGHVPACVNGCSVQQQVGDTSAALGIGMQHLNMHVSIHRQNCHMKKLVSGQEQE